VNALDLAIVVGAVAAAIGGYRLGLLARAAAWVGLIVALLLAVHFIPKLTTLLADASPRGRLFAVLAFVFGAALLGQALGLTVGGFVHDRLHIHGPARVVDRVFGALIGALGVLFVVWLMVPALTSAQGWTAREAGGSSIVAAIEHVGVEPPANMQALGRVVAEDRAPQVFGPGDSPSNPGRPPAIALSPAVDEYVVQAVAKVEGQACDQIQDGTGFVVAPGVLVTNAHVVAGEQRTHIFTSDGRRFNARVVVFDPRRDVAVLRVSSAAGDPLRLATGSVGDPAVVYGHPEGGPLTRSPARVSERIDATGTDIYRTTQTERDVYVLAAHLAPGDSGAPVVDRSGAAIAMAFAIDPGNSGTGYALTTKEIHGLLQNVPTATVDTGSCLVG
jgi:S1-C subfamily serine protease